RHGHEPADLRIITGQLPNLTVEIVDLVLDVLARLEQRSDRGHQFGTPFDQRLGAHGEDIELGAAADKILNHQSGTISGVAAVYQRHQFLSERKDALDRWGAHLATILVKATRELGKLR